MKKLLVALAIMVGSFGIAHEASAALPYDCHTSRQGTKVGTACIEGLGSYRVWVACYNNGHSWDRYYRFGKWQHPDGVHVYVSVARCDYGDTIYTFGLTKIAGYRA